MSMKKKGAAFAARATGFPLDRTVKTLVVDLGGRNYCLALLPGDRQLDLKQLAQVFALKRAAMADTATAERLTGYPVARHQPVRHETGAAGRHGKADPRIQGNAHQCRSTGRDAEDGLGRHRKGAWVPGGVNI